MTRISTALMMLTLAFSASTVRAQEALTRSPDGRVLGDFKVRVEKYDQLRKNAADSAPPLEKTKDAAKINDAQRGLAERVGAARMAPQHPCGAA